MASIKQSLIAPAMMKDEETKESSEWNALMKQREQAHREHLKASAGQTDQAVAVEKVNNTGTLEDMEEKIKALKTLDMQHLGRFVTGARYPEHGFRLGQSINAGSHRSRLRILQSRDDRFVTADQECFAVNERHGVVDIRIPGHAA